MVLNPSVSVRFSVKMREIGFASIISLTGLRVGDGGVRLRTIGGRFHGHWIGQSNRGSFITDYECLVVEYSQRILFLSHLSGS